MTDEAGGFATGPFTALFDVTAVTERWGVWDPFPALTERAAWGVVFLAKGGHNDEEHNHNDVGSFSIALDGDPLVVDAGVNTHTAQTFGPQP